MKKYSNTPLSFNRLTEFKYLYQSHQVARTSKQHKKEVIEFELNLAHNLITLQQQLRNKTYKIGKYRLFQIYEPKKREIQAISYKDRIVQHSLCDNFLIPYYKNKLILCNCACQQNKGTYFARKKLKEFFNEFFKTNGYKGYILKCDIHKYFASIDHFELKKLLSKIGDVDIKNLLFHIIDSYNHDVQKGLPIGNQISQIMGVVFLDKVDRLIKEKLRIKYYIRYMDDLILIHQNKNYLKFCFEKIKVELKNIKLEFNNKTQITSLKQGVQFLGAVYNILPSGKIVLKVKQQSKQRFYRNIKAIKYLKTNEKIDKSSIQGSLAGYKGHFKGFKAFCLLKKVTYDLLC